MIARIWRGETRTEDAAAYARVLERTGLRDVRATSGNTGAWVLRHDEGGRTTFVLFTLWDSVEAIAAFAGTPIERARHYPQDADYLLDVRRDVEHFEVSGGWSQGGDAMRAA